MGEEVICKDLQLPDYIFDFDIFFIFFYRSSGNLPIQIRLDSLLKDDS